MNTRLIAAGLAVVAGGLGLSAFLVHRTAHSADHLDSPATRADATLDINDVFTWMDGTNFVAAMTLYPNAPSSALFSDSVQYVIHTSSGASYTGGTSSKYDIICTFQGMAPQTAQCWAGANEYATGNASQTNGIQSTDGKFKVFAGLRADPFHFNLDGFHNTVNAVETYLDAGLITTNDAGCPLIDGVTAGALRTALASGADGGAPNDFFKTFNALAIVVSLDKSLVSAAGPIVSVWGATHH